jgi:AhpD family alkylhydroperoxidase
MRLPYARLSPDAYQAMSALGHVIHTESALDKPLLELIYLRASLLNGCDFCVKMHRHELEKVHEPQSRIDAVQDWKASDAFTLRERAALAWADAVTNIQQHHASDEDYAAVNQFFSGKDLVDLTWAIANINSWNRMGIAFAPEWKPTHERAAAEQTGDEVVDAVGDDGGKVSAE